MDRVHCVSQKSQEHAFDLCIVHVISLYHIPVDSVVVHYIDWGGVCFTKATHCVCSCLLINK